MAHTAQDDGFHEIQLNGKQLFFLFMAATVVSVVIFLLGVMFGRGVRAERNAVAEAEALSDSPSADAQPAGSSTQADPAAGADLTMVPPPPPADDLGEVRPNTEADLKRASRPPDTGTPATPAKPATAERGGAPARDEPTSPRPPPARSAAAASVAPATTPAAGGWVVQVAALKTQSEAAEYAKGLNTKGYVAYIAEPQSGTSVYRVRLGGFNTRREAQTAADKLQKEMGVKPWVTQ